MRLKNYKDALEQFIECYEISREHLDKPPLDTFKMLSDIGDCEYHLKQYPHSIDSFKCAETVARKYPQDIPTSYIFHALRRIGDAHLKMNEAEDALEYLQRAKEKGTGSLSSSEMAQVVVSIASCNLALSNFDQAIDDNKLAIELHSKDHNKRSNLEISRCYFFMGTAHLKSKRPAQALECFDKSIDSRLKGGEPRNSELGLIYSQKGLVHFLQKEFRQAIEAYKEAVSCITLGNKSKPRGLFDCLTYLGSSYLGVDKLKDAKSTLEEAASLEKEAEEAADHTRARCFYSLGCLYFQEQELTKAADYLEKALEIYNKLPQPQNAEETDCLNKIGHLQLSTSKNLALITFAKAESISSNSESTPLERKAFANFYLGCLKMRSGDHRSAYGALTNARSHLQNLVEREPEGTYKTLKSKRDWLVCIFTLAKCSINSKCPQDGLAALKTLKDTVEAHIANNTQMGSLAIFLPDEFTEIDVVSQFWDLYLELAKECGDWEAEALALTKLLREKGKSNSEKDNIKLALAQVYEREGNTTMASKYFQVLAAKAEDPELKKLSKRKLAEIVGESETRSANLNRERRTGDQLERKDGFSAKTSISGGRSQGKTPKNCIIFTPNTPNNKRNNISSSAIDNGLRKHVTSLSGNPQDTPHTNGYNKSSNSPSPAKAYQNKEANFGSHKERTNRPQPTEKPDPIKPPEDYSKKLSSPFSKKNIVETALASKRDRQIDSKYSSTLENSENGIQKSPPSAEKSKYKYSPPGIQHLKKPKPSTIEPREVESKKKYSDKTTPKEDFTQTMVTRPSLATPASKAASNTKTVQDSPLKGSPLKASIGSKRYEDIKSSKNTEKEIDDGLGDRLRPKKQDNVSSSRQTLAKISLPVGAPIFATTSTVQHSTTTSVGSIIETVKVPVNPSQLPSKKDLPLYHEPKANEDLNANDPRNRQLKEGPAELSPGLKTKLRIVDTQKFKEREDSKLKSAVENHHKDTESAELIESIYMFFTKVGGLMNEKKWAEAERFLAKSNSTLAESGIPTEKLAPLIAFELYLLARLDIYKGKLLDAEKKLKMAIDKQPADPATLKIPTHRLYIELAELYFSANDHTKSLDTVCNYLKLHHEQSGEGTLACLKLFFKVIESVNLQGNDSVSANSISSIGQKQLHILKKVEDLARLQFKNVSLPSNLFIDKRLECLLVLASAHLIVEDMKKAEEYLSKFFVDLSSLDGDRIVLVKEMFDTLIAANARELASKYLKKTDEKLKDWPMEDKSLYLATVCTKLGAAASKEKRFAEGLVYYDKGLDFMKRFDIHSITDKKSPKAKIFYSILYNTANCCFEEKELERADFFNKKAEEFCDPKSEDMADCLLLGAKLSLESTRLEEAIDKCQKSLYVGGRNRNKFQLCDTYFTKGKCYLQLKKRDKAFEAFKSARQTLEYLKSQPRDYIEFKNKIDEAFLNFPNRNN